MNNHFQIKGIIYLIKNRINNKCYVGQTYRKLRKRITAHISDFRQGHTTALYRAFNKYGLENFDVYVLEFNIPLWLLNYKEIYYTLKYNALSPNGYVLNAGGGREGVVSEETKRKLREIRKKMVYSKEVCLKISESKKGKRNPMYGKTHSDEMKRAMSKRLTGHSMNLKAWVFDYVQNIRTDYILGLPLKNIQNKYYEFGISKTLIKMIIYNQKFYDGNYDIIRKSYYRMINYKEVRREQVA